MSAGNSQAKSLPTLHLALEVDPSIHPFSITAFWCTQGRDGQFIAEPYGKTSAHTHPYGQFEIPSFENSSLNRENMQVCVQHHCGLQATTFLLGCIPFGNFHLGIGVS